MSRSHEAMGHDLGEAFESESETIHDHRAARRYPPPRDHRRPPTAYPRTPGHPHSPAYARAAVHHSPVFGHHHVHSPAHHHVNAVARSPWLTATARSRVQPFYGSNAALRDWRYGNYDYPGQNRGVSPDFSRPGGRRRGSWLFNQPVEAAPDWLRRLLRSLAAERGMPLPDPSDPPPADSAPEPADAAPPDAAAADAASPDTAPPDAGPPAGELEPWLELENEAPPASNPMLAQAVARWKLQTGIPSAPTLAALIDRYRPSHAPEIPTTLLVAFTVFEGSGWSDATHGTAGNHFTSPPFYELGIFQTPAGLHGVCSGPKHQNCAQQPPGQEKPGDPSAWSRICKRLNLRPDLWQDPTTQVRVGLTNLEDDARRIRALFPELFKNPGSDWDLRAAVLMPFVGIGFAKSSLQANRAALAKLPEADRFQFLKTKVIASNPARAATFRGWFANIEKKMSLHAALAAHLQTNPAAGNAAGSVRPVAPAPSRQSYAAAAPSGASLVGSDVTRFATQLGAAWSRQRGGNPTPDAMRDWLLKDQRETLVGALGRYKKRYSEAEITRAWMVSREQQMRFQLAAGKIPALRGFNPPSAPVTRVESKLIEGSKEEKVAPVVVRFVEQLRKLTRGFSASTYARHGGGSFLSKGYSIDLFPDTTLDARGFYRPDAAIEFLRAVGKAAAAVNLEWRVLYNDYTVAEVINRENGVQRVAFIGRAAGNNVIWHGPKPLILHFHLDLGVKS